MSCSEWKKVKLGEVCKFEKSICKPIKDIKYMHYSLPAFDNKRTPEEQWGNEIKSSKFFIPVNCILYNKLNVRFKRIWNIKSLVSKNNICSTEFIPIVPLTVCQDFLYYVLISNKTTNLIQSMRTGTSSSHQRISPDDLLNFTFNLPPLPEQKAIASVLSALDDKIELNNKINKNLEEMAQAIFKSWFVDFEPFAGLQPTSWKILLLDECCSLISKGITPKYDETSSQFVINQKCIRDHKINLDLARTHSPKKINEKWLNYGDIVINSTGQGTLGRTAQVLFYSKNYTVDSHVTIVRPIQPELVYYMGYWCLSREHEFELMASGSTGQTDLPRERLKHMPIIVPSKDILLTFTQLIKPISKQIVSNQIETQKLAQLRDTLLPKLMSGEIRVPIEE